MPKVTIDEDEYYPFRSFKIEDTKWSVEVDEKTLSRWKRVMEQFKKVQDEMKAVSDSVDY